MGMANTFGARLVLARNEKGLGQMTLAERVGMAQTQLSRYETDKVRPRLRIINSLAAALSVDPDWLLNGDDDADVEPVDTAPTTQCKLRIPVDLYAGLSKLAGAASRSLNAEIVHPGNWAPRHRPGKPRSFTSCTPMLLAPPEGHSSGEMALLGMGQVSAPRLRAVASPSKHGSRHREGTAGGMPCRE